MQAKPGAELTSQTSDNSNRVSTSIQEVNGAIQSIRGLSQEAHTSSENVSRSLASLLEETTNRLSSFQGKKSPGSEVQQEDAIESSPELHQPGTSNASPSFSKPAAGLLRASSIP